MRLLSIPGLISICILLTHSSRFVLSTGNPKASSQASRNQGGTSKAPDGSQSSSSAARSAQASGTSASGGSAVNASQTAKPTNTSTPSTPASQPSESMSTTPSGPSVGQTPVTPTPTSGNPVTQTGSEQLVVLDLTKKESCNEYEYSKDNATNAETYTVKPGYKFSQVKNGNTDVWNPTNNEYATKVTLTTDDQNKTTVKVDTDDSTPSSPSQGLTGTNPGTPSSDTQVEDSDLKITTEGSDGTTKVNYLTHFDLEIYRKFHKFEFKDGVKCKKFEVGKDTLYEFGKTEPKDKHPKSLCLFKNGSLVLYDMSDAKFLLLGLTSDKKLESELLTGLSDLSDSNIKIVTKDRTNNTKENDTSKYDFEKLDFGLQYKFKDDAECVEIKYDDESVWKSASAKNLTTNPESNPASTPTNNSTSDSANNPPSKPANNPASK